ncbi:ATP-binding protein [Pedobacter ginsengisoli]|uniref:ATP-binding protein n=1 Tax=Pedobacter ginsengisoli TaxID=363852 RepID=UPI001562A18D|nr:ATP-binding protein [Pedobacter ginsengisoli]
MITGPTGIGKSYIASALGHQACANEYKVLYWSTPKLFTRLKQAKADNSYTKEMLKIERSELLILDDFGLHPLDAPSRAMLMEIIEDRHEQMSLIITSQLPVSAWFDMIGDKTIADAILDRIVHNAHRIDAIGYDHNMVMESPLQDIRINNLLRYYFTFRLSIIITFYRTLSAKLSSFCYQPILH